MGDFIKVTYNKQNRLRPLARVVCFAFFMLAGVVRGAEAFVLTGGDTDGNPAATLVAGSEAFSLTSGDTVPPTPHSARKAIILSAVLPGAGQVYNHQAWKIPIIYGALAGVGYYTYSNYTQMKFYKDEYLYRVNNNGASLHPDDVDVTATPTSNIYNLYETYNKTFQLSVIITVAVYGLNLVDAYVFGHLFDFQISDDLSLNVSPSLLPTMQGQGSGAGLPHAGMSIHPSSLSLIPAASLTLRF